MFLSKPEKMGWMKAKEFAFPPLSWTSRAYGPILYCTVSAALMLYPFVLSKLVTYFLRCIFLITSYSVIFYYQIVYLRLHQSDKLLILPMLGIS